MTRNIDINETGSYGIEDNDVNVAGVWSNQETGRHSMGGGQMTVGTDVLTTALGDAHEEAGGMKAADIGIEAQIDRRESIRAPRGFDDPEMHRESFTLAMEERIEAEAEADRKSTALAERYEAISQEAEDEGVEIKSRAERCREEVTSGSYYQQTTSEEPVEVETRPENPWPELTQEEVAKVNQSAAQLAEKFEHETAMGRASMSKLLAQRVADGQSVTSAVLGLQDVIQKFPEVKQPIAHIDPFGQYQTTIEGTIDVLWRPKGEGQRQVGLISDESGEAIKITVWIRAGDKPTLREGDKVRVVRGKVNAYQRGGEWETSIAIDSDAEIHHLEKGDGPGTRRKISREEPSIDPWDADSKTHSWHNDMDPSDVVSPNVGLSDEKVEALNEWVRGQITLEEVDEHAEALAEDEA